MYKISLEGLLAIGRSYYGEEEAEYLVVVIEGNADTPEIIVNPKKNFKKKLEYYEKAYTEDLKLKANPEIRITNYHYVESKEELNELLNQILL